MPRGPGTTTSRAIRLLMAGPLRTVDLAERLDLGRRAAEKVIESLREDWKLTTEKRGRER